MLKNVITKKCLATLKSYLLFLYPPRCSFCSTHLESTHHAVAARDGQKNGGQTLLRKFICPKCLDLSSADLVYSNHSDKFSSNINKQLFCKGCGQIFHRQLECNLCYLCLWNPFAFNELRSIFFYQDQFKSLIKKYKYSNARNLHKLFSAQLANFSRTHSTFGFTNTDWDMIIPLPSANRKLRQRGFNHMGLVVSSFSRLFSKIISTSQPNLQAKGLKIPSSLSAVLRVDKLPDRAKMPLSSRHFKPIFKVKTSKVLGKKILIIDDVVTTGNSLHEAALALRAAGAERIDCLTLACSKNFFKNRLNLFLHRLK